MSFLEVETGHRSKNETRDLIDPLALS